MDIDKITRAEAARILGVSYQTIVNWIDSGKLTEYQVKLKKKVSRTEVLEILESARK